MSPLVLVLSMLVVTVVTGPFIVAAFTLGLYGWPAVLLGLALGLFGAAALARRVEREIKRQDPAWDEEADRPRLLPIRVRRDERARRSDPRARWRR